MEQGLARGAARWPRTFQGGAQRATHAHQEESKVAWDRKEIARAEQLYLKAKKPELIVDQYKKARERRAEDRAALKRREAQLSHARPKPLYKRLEDDYKEKEARDS